jgi:hypothetical protein
MAYALVEELRQVMDIPPEDTSTDVDLQRALDAGATWIDWFTGRTFGTTGTTAAPTARTYAAVTEDTVALVDLQSTAPLVEVDSAGDRTFATTLVAAQYALNPLGGPPFDELQAWAAPAGGVEPVCFAVGQLVRVTGVWGYTDARGRLPAAVNEANLLLGARYFKRREVPFAVLQAPELDAFQNLPRQDVDVLQLLFPLSRPGSPGAALAAAQLPAAGAPTGAAAWVLV